MAQKLSAVVYPQNVPELLTSQGTNELIRRLKLLYEALRDTEQDSNEANKYKALALHLSSDFLMSSQSREVRIYVANCVAEILRIFAPDAPYGDPHQLKTVLMFLVKQLRGLDHPKDPLHVHYFLLLENLALVKTMNIILELEESQEFIIVMFKLFFAILQTDGITSKVQDMLIDILASLVRDCDFLSIPALDSLLINLIEPHKTQNRTAYRCARNLIDSTNTAIQTHIEAYLLTTIAEGKNTESGLGEFIFEIVFEIHRILPQVMTRIWPKLEEKIISSETKERMDTVRLLTKLFTDKDSNAYEECPSMWNLFLSRFNDKSLEIRLQCIKASTEMMLSHSKLRNDICEVLMQRFRDTEDTVRVQTITTMLILSKKDFGIITDDIMNCIKDRTLDKKFKVRREACLCLGAFYRKMILNPDASMSELKRVAFIKNKLLHMYYQQNLEDRILCEKLLNTCLVPFLLETEDRMNKMYHLYCTIDENASKAFNEIFRQQHQIRALLKSIVHCENGDNKTDLVETQLNRLKRLSEYFLDPRAFDNLKSFYDFMVDDVQMTKMMHYLTGDVYNAEEIQNTVKNMLTKVGPQSKHWNIHGTVRALLERAAPILIDNRSIEFLIGKVRRSAETASIDFSLDDLDMSEQQIAERAFNLLQLLSSSFPSAFYTEDSLSMLLDFLKEGNMAAIDPIVQIFKNVGRKNSTDFPAVYKELLPELKKVAITGSEKQAKHAVFCIAKIWPQDINVIESLFDDAVKNVEVRNAHVQAAFATLSAIARLRPNEFRDRLKAIVSIKVVKNIILHEEPHTGCTEKNENDKSWLATDELSIETKAKISAVKFLVYRLLGMKSNDDNHGTNTLKLLNGLIESGGNLQEIKMRYAERAHLRLVAGWYFLKLLREKLFVELMSVRQYVNLCYLITDECWHVRGKFATQLHKNLYAMRIPLEMMAAFALVPLIKLSGDAENEEQILKTFRIQVRDSILLNYRRRKDYMRKNPNLQSLPWKYLPEYYVCYATYLLAHYSDFESYDDVDALRELKDCMWFVLEPILNRKDADRAPPLLLTKIFNDIKLSRDVSDANDLDQAKKMWAVCDLGCLVVNTRIVSIDVNSSQFKVLLPKRFFTPPKRGTAATNTEVFLPALIIQEETASAHRAKLASRGGLSSTTASRAVSGRGRGGGSASIRSYAGSANGFAASRKPAAGGGGASSSDDEEEGSDYDDEANRRAVQRGGKSTRGNSSGGGATLKRMAMARRGEESAAAPPDDDLLSVASPQMTRAGRVTKVSATFKTLARE